MLVPGSLWRHTDAGAPPCETRRRNTHCTARCRTSNGWCHCTVRVTTLKNTARDSTGSHISAQPHACATSSATGSTAGGASAGIATPGTSDLRIAMICSTTTAMSPHPVSHRSRRPSKYPHTDATLSASSHSQARLPTDEAPQGPVLPHGAVWVPQRLLWHPPASEQPHSLSESDSRAEEARTVQSPHPNETIDRVAASPCNAPGASPKLPVDLPANAVLSQLE